jgi:hypothetical protein
MTKMTDPMLSGIKGNAAADMDFLKVITEPFTKLIVQVSIIFVLYILIGNFQPPSIRL